MLAFMLTQALNASSQQAGASHPTLKNSKDTACRPIKVADIPGYSANNRYFNAGLTESFILNQGSFAVYQAGSGDSYSWDSLDVCRGKYVFHYGNEGGQEPNLRGQTIFAEIHRHHFTLLNNMGTYGPGTYDLLFDFNDNEKSTTAPAPDTGRWQTGVTGSPFHFITIKSRAVEIGAATAPAVQKCRIDQVQIDHVDHSSLYVIVPLGPGILQPGAPQQFIIKHSPTNTVILIGPGQPPVTQIIRYFTKM